MVTIEAAGPQDVDALADLWVELAESQREFGSHLLTDGNRSAVRDAIVRRVVADELLVARDGDRVVGFVMFTVQSGAYEQDATRGVVQNLYVTEARRDEGIGSDLLAEAESALAETDAEIVSLEVMADNEAARRFYRRHGYGPHRIELEKSVESDTLTKE